MRQLTGAREVLKGLPPPAVWWLRMQRDIWAVEVPSEEEEVPVPHQTSQPRAPVPGRGILTTAGCENLQGFHSGEREGCRRPRCPLKGPMLRLADRRRRSEL